MSFGNELKDFVTSFQSGYDWMEKREERKLDRAERAEDRQYRRDRDATMDARDERNFLYGMGRDQVNDAWRQEGRAFEWEQTGITNARNAANDQRAIEQDEWTRSNGDRVRDQQDRIIDGQERRDNWSREKDLLELEAGAGVLPDDYDPNAPGFEPMSYGGDTNALLQQTSWTPGGGTAFRPSSGRRTARGTMGMSGPDIAQAMVYDLGRDLGLPQGAAIGLVGQLAGETGGFKHHQEIKPVVPGSRGGAGYSQWTGPRRRQFEAFAQERGLDPQSYEANYGFLRHELTRTSEGRILDRIRDVNDPIQAGRIFTGSEASRSGFLRPRHVNTAGRDRWTNRVAGLFGGGQRQVRAARGGMIEEQEAMPFEADDPLGDEYGPEEASVPTPTPAPRGAIPDPVYDGEDASTDTEEGTPSGVRNAMRAGTEAVREGLLTVVKGAGLDQQEAIQDERMARVRQDYLKGYGAAPAGMMRRVADMIDPDKRMNPAQRNLAAMGNVYNHFMERGELDKAKEAAASMIQYHQQAFNQFTALAQSAIEDGRLDDATKAAMAAYTNIPDGNDMQIEKGENGGYTISFTDAETGEEIERAVLDPSQMAEQIMGFNPGTFNQAIYEAAGRKVEHETMSAGDREEYDMSVRGHVQDRLGEDSQFSPDQVDIIGDIATNIGAFNDNNLNGSQAARLAIMLAGAEAKQDGDGNWVVEEGGKSISEPIPGSSNYRIKLGARSIVIDPGTLQDLQGVKGARREEAEGDITTARGNAERRSNAMNTAAEGFSSVLGAIGNAFAPDPNAATPEERAGTRNENLGVIADTARSAGRAIADTVAPAVDMFRPSNGAVEELLERKRQIVEGPDASDPARIAQVRRIDDQLRRLGYEGEEQAGGAIPE